MARPGHTEKRIDRREPAYKTKREKNPHNHELPILIGIFFFFFFFFFFFALVIRFSPISSFPLDFNQIYTKSCD